MKINQDIQEPSDSSKKNTITVKKENYIDFFNENKDYFTSFLDFSNKLLKNPYVPQALKNDILICQKPTLDMIEGKDSIEIDLEASYRYFGFANRLCDFAKLHNK